MNSLTQGLGQARKGLVAERTDLYERIDRLTAEVRREVGRRFDRRTGAREAALQSGVARDKLTLEAAVVEASEIAGELEVVSGAHPDDVASLETTVRALASAADGVWSAVSLSERDEYLRGAARLATSQRDDWQATRSDRLDVERALGALVRESGDETRLGEKIAAARDGLKAVASDLADADRRASVLTQARHWLEARDVESELDCPVCERPIQSTELKAIVSAALEVLTAENGRVAELGEAHTDAASAVEDLERIIEVVARQREKVNKLRAGELRLATGIIVEIRKMAAGGLPEGDEIAAPVATAIAVLNNLVGDVAAEDLDAFPSDDVNAALGRLQGSVATAQQKTAKEVAEAGSSARALRERVVALEKAVAFLEADLSLNALDGVVAGQNSMRPAPRSAPSTRNSTF